MMATASACEAAAADGAFPQPRTLLMLAAMARIVFSRRRTTLLPRREPTSGESRRTGGDRGTPLVTSEMAWTRSVVGPARGCRVGGEDALAAEPSGESGGGWEVIGES